MSEEKNIPINKGHFNLDTDERVREFHRKLASGWEEEYKKYRDAWESYPKKRVVRKFPIQVDLELSSACNLKCPMCYTSTDEFKNSIKTSFMDFKLATKIIDEVAGHIYALRLSWRGESTLHPQFVEVIKYAKDKGIKEVSFLTNGSKLSPDYFEQIVTAGADWITISVDGMEDVYNKIRKPLTFSDMLQKLKDIKTYKDKNNLIKPVIKVQTIWPAIRDNPQLYYDTFAPITDLIAFNPLIDYLGRDEDIVYMENFSCPQLYERLFVSSDGLVMMCNSDEFSLQPVGDANEETIYDIWHGDKLNEVRKLHNKRDGFKSFRMCRKCFFPRETEVNETVTVNGRTINIENYINREQKIGE